MDKKTYMICNSMIKRPGISVIHQLEILAQERRKKTEGEMPNLTSSDETNLKCIVSCLRLRASVPLGRHLIDNLDRGHLLRFFRRDSVELNDPIKNYKRISNNF